jgi:hypothetical protein
MHRHGLQMVQHLALPAKRRRLSARPDLNRARVCPFGGIGWVEPLTGPGTGEARQGRLSGGLPPVPIRWLLVRDPRGELPPQAFLCTDLAAAPVDILQWFVARWQLEVIFQEARAHLSVETRRQWSDLAILRTTPALLGLFSLVALWAHDLAAENPLLPATAAWYHESHCTFSDAIAAVRRQIWHHQVSFMSWSHRDRVIAARQLWDRAANALAYAA